MLSENGSSAPPGRYSRRLAESERWMDEDYARVDALEWIEEIGRRWKLVSLCTAVPLLLTFSFTRFAMAPKWAAAATLRPLNKQAQLQEMMGPLAGGILSTTMSGFGSVLGISQQSDEANELISIMNSYDFTTKIIARHNLAPYLNAEKSPLAWLLGDQPKSGWKLYQQMDACFDAEFDTDSGNLELRFVDHNPQMAAQILGWYIGELRAMLRADEIRRARSALASLRTEAARTEDAYLQSQLYQLAAVQLGNAKMAEAQSDFTFKEIQSPVVSDRPYSPRPALDSALAAISGLMCSCLWIVLSVSLRRREPRAGHAAPDGAGYGGNRELAAVGDAPRL